MNFWSIGRHTQFNFSAYWLLFHRSLSLYLVGEKKKADAWSLWNYKLRIELKYYSYDMLSCIAEIIITYELIETV